MSRYTAVRNFEDYRNLTDIDRDDFPDDHAYLHQPFSTDWEIKVDQVEDAPPPSRYVPVTEPNWQGSRGRKKKAPVISLSYDVQRRIAAIPSPSQAAWAFNEALLKRLSEK